jgi:hypothetical protein
MTISSNCKPELHAEGGKMERTIEEDIQRIRQRLNNCDEVEVCKGELEKILEIERAWLWRADVGSCCGTIRCVSPAQLSLEIQLLEQASEAINSGNSALAASILDVYIQRFERPMEQPL